MLQLMVCGDAISSRLPHVSIARLPGGVCKASADDTEVKAKQQNDVEKYGLEAGLFKVGPTGL